MPHRNKRHRLRLKSVFLWHRYIGLTVVLFLIIITASGWLINHSEDFKLDKKFIASETLLNWYGIRLPDNIVSYRAGSHWITQLGNRIYFDNQEIISTDEPLIGAVQMHQHQHLSQYLIAVKKNELLLLLPSGELIERINSSHGLPQELLASGIDAEGQFVIKTALGNQKSDQDLIGWQPSQAVNVEWSRPAALPEALVKRLTNQYRGNSLTVERVILNIHSGRILGETGRLIVDMVSFMIMALAATGLWHWGRRRR